MESPRDIFQYRKRVRCIAILDICTALFMITIFGIKFSVRRQRFEEFPPQGIVILAVFSLQLVMAHLLLTATYQNDVKIALSRCAKWYWTSHFLYLILSIEFVLMFWGNGPLILPVIKILFRVIANYTVNLYMIDLRVLAAEPPPFVETLTPPLPYRSACAEAPTMRVPPQYRSNPPLPEEPPPSYEEATKTKDDGSGAICESTSINIDCGDTNNSNSTTNSSSAEIDTNTTTASTVTTNTETTNSTNHTNSNTTTTTPPTND